MALDEEPVSLGALARLFLRVGVTAFGGPAAHIGLMREEVVDRRGWVDRNRFMDALGVTNLIPGPNSSELAIHIGYMLRGQVGALTAGVSFALPAVVIMIVVSSVYFALGGFALRDDLFVGIQPVVISIVVVTVWRLRDAVGSPFLVAIGVASAILTLTLPGLEAVWLLGGGALTLAVWALRDRASRGEPGGTLFSVAIPVAAIGAILAALPALAWVFLKTGALLFGGGYVLIPLLEPQVVDRGWLTRAQFLDGIALGEATPGPIVTSSAFVGYGVAGVPGALVATVAIYLPAFVSVMAVAGPFLRSFSQHPAIRAAVRGLNAAAVGAIAGAAVSLGRVALASPFRAVIGGVALVLLVLRVPVWAVLLGGAVVGLTVGLIG